MIVDAKSKAQGVKRDGCKLSQTDSVYTKFSTSMNVLLGNRKKWVIQ
jgi:hypothetical protein